MTDRHKLLIREILAVGIICSALISILIFISIVSYNVTAADNDTIIVKVNVTNSEPILYNVYVEPTSVILEAGSYTTVNCTGQVYDINGWNDITSVNASIYDTSYGYDDDPNTADNNYRYFNQSCNCTSIDTLNASCSCLFSVQYYANNGTWQCNMTVADSYGVTSIRNSSNFDIEALTAIDVPSLLDFGNLSVGEESDYIPINVSNYGNVQINVSVRGWGGTDPYSPTVDDIGLICQTGNISTTSEKYALNSSVVYDLMTNLTNTSTRIPNLNLAIRTNDTVPTNDVNTTYWKLKIPLSVFGVCNGTIEFKAGEI